MSPAQTTKIRGKKKTLVASEQLSERVQKRRYEWRLWPYSIDVRNLIFIDETGVNLGMVRRYGRCKGGERVYDDRPGNQGKNVTLVGAMSDEGLIAAMTLPGGLNTPSFLVYVEKILLPELWVGAIVVMDNLPVDHVEAVESRIESVGEASKILTSLLAGCITHRVVLVKNKSNSSFPRL